MLYRSLAVLREPLFQSVLLVWTGMLTTVVIHPNANGFGIDTHVYRNALANMLAGRDAYLVPDPVATAIADGIPIYFFPPPPAGLLGGAIAAIAPGNYLALVVNVAVVLAAFLLVRPLVGPVSNSSKLVDARVLLAGAALAWVFFPPMVDLLTTGNQNSFFLLSIALVAYGVVRPAPIWTAVGLALAVVLKPAAALFALPLLVSGRWREVAGGSAIAGLVVLLSIAVVGLKPWLDFAEAVLFHSSVVAGQGASVSLIQSLLPGVPSFAWIGLTAAAIALAGKLPPRRMLAASIFIFLLGWPVLWWHYAVLALVGMALLMRDVRTGQTLALAYLLLSIPFGLGWVPAIVLLLVATLRSPAVGEVTTTEGETQLRGAERRVIASPGARSAS